MKTKNEITLERVSKQIDKLEARLTPLRQERQRLRFAVRDEQARAKLIPHIGGPVKMAHYDRKDPYREATGTLLEVRRTRCLVDFGPKARWLFPCDEIIPAAEERTGFVINL